MILFIEGINETRELAITLQQQGHRVITQNTCLTGTFLMNSLSVHEMVDMITEHEVTCVVDASHPFAKEASKTAMEAAFNCGVSYVRYEHPQLVM
ncbi:precorrin-6A/cobalt-precorrin-6A reductase [Metasolibacillus sp.]|uniref:precorrin-6A/cobalt-precorrin-6A reductase n=1 Tax=Metasolibacillus sp. TaxID=2703680 RepID=UPI0025DAE7F2|nr:precorrin-6A/cobalt-precorrin-6A reductase [Metasolibacillus sp.]MCT6925589.1 precorrin-6A/cobalt-precorrin-6A reductase [Metasolibacillus sp.]MCT6941841.1 precorrin-6A/cobalt-precorrin-6A reductase [Metasolibacillus sp.]